jgi:hypothetical protein
MVVSGFVIANMPNLVNGAAMVVSGRLRVDACDG